MHFNFKWRVVYFLTVLQLTRRTTNQAYVVLVDSKNWNICKPLPVENIKPFHFWMVVTSKQQQVWFLLKVELAYFFLENKMQIFFTWLVKRNSDFRSFTWHTIILRWVSPLVRAFQALPDWQQVRATSLGLIFG